MGAEPEAQVGIVGKREYSFVKKKTLKVSQTFRVYLIYFNNRLFHNPALIQKRDRFFVLAMLPHQREEPDSAFAENEMRTWDEDLAINSLDLGKLYFTSAPELNWLPIDPRTGSRVQPQGKR